MVERWSYVPHRLQRLARSLSPAVRPSARIAAWAGSGRADESYLDRNLPSLCSFDILLGKSIRREVGSRLRRISKVLGQTVFKNF